MEKALRWTVRLTGGLLALSLLGSSARPSRLAGDLVHRYTAPIEFDFGGWTLRAAGVKLGQASLGGASYIAGEDRSALVRDFLDRLAHAERLEEEVRRIYADPSIADPKSASSSLREESQRARRDLRARQPTVESLIQEQASVVLTEAGLAPVPPVSFHFSPLPMALVVSPRAEIRQEALIQLLPDLAIEDQVELERKVEADLGLSALVVPVGGIGTYPTMVQETTALNWVAEVVLHEWVHNYLTLRPLGWAYDASAETRTMNETAATLLGQAFGRRLIESYYPERNPAPSPPTDSASPAVTPDPAAFDFNAEMHLTRLEVDRLLAQGMVEEAEAYMETRRRMFVENGYILRRLNQAYFAFHGAYADAPQGPAGADPVGEAVRELWARIDSPTRFLREMAGMNSYDDLRRRLERSLEVG